MTEYYDHFKHPDHDYFGCEICGNKVMAVITLGNTSKDIENLMGVCLKHMKIEELREWRRIHLRNLRNVQTRDPERKYDPEYYKKKVHNG